MVLAVGGVRVPCAGVAVAVLVMWRASMSGRVMVYGAAAVQVRVSRAWMVVVVAPVGLVQVMEGRRGSVMVRLVMGRAVGLVTVKE